MKELDKLHYVITRKVAGNAHQFVISKNDFEEAERSYHILQLSVFAEERFDAIARNFFELESDMLATILETSYVGFGAGMEQMAIRRLLNRRMTNVLTATKSYIDHMHHAAKILFNKDKRTNNELMKCAIDFPIISTILLATESLRHCVTILSIVDSQFILCVTQLRFFIIEMGHR